MFESSAARPNSRRGGRREASHQSWQAVFPPPGGSPDPCPLGNRAFLPTGKLPDRLPTCRAERLSLPTPSANPRPACSFSCSTWALEWWNQGSQEVSQTKLLSHFRAGPEKPRRLQSGGAAEQKAQRLSLGTHLEAVPNLSPRCLSSLSQNHRE